MEIEEIVYRGYGPHQRKGGGFSTLGVTTQADLEKALADGWYRTMPEAIEAHDNPKPAETAESKIPDDNAPPTRAELEQKAKELGIKFDKRTTDKSLAEKIAAKV